MRFLFLLSLSLLLYGCELIYDPSTWGQAPAGPGSEWPCKEYRYEEYTVPAYPLEEINGAMTVANLLDIALYNNPSTRASWYAARATAYGYHASLSEYYPTLEYFGAIIAQKGLGSSIINQNNAVTPIINPLINPARGLLGGAKVNPKADPPMASTNPSTTPRVPTRLYTVENQFIASYLLLDFGGRDAQADLAWQTLYEANWQHNFTMQEVMLSVINAYTAYEGNKALVLADEQDVKDAEVAVQAAQVMKRAGLATQTDLLLALSTLEQMKLNLQQAIASEKTSFAQLLVALGLPAATEIEVVDLPDALPVVEIAGDLASLLDLAKERRPDLQVTMAQVKALQDQAVISFSAGMPTLTTNAAATRFHFINNRANDTLTKSVNLAWSVPIFNGFLYLNQQRQLQTEVLEALANVDVQVATISVQVATNYYTLMAAIAALPNSLALLDYSQRAYRGFLAQYRVGTASILDVLTALTTLSNARAQYVQIRTQWANALANLAFSVGVLEDTSFEWKSAPPKELYRLTQ